MSGFDPFWGRPTLEQHRRTVESAIGTELGPGAYAGIRAGWRHFLIEEFWKRNFYDPRTGEVKRK
jgi:hypothetical protein